MEILRIHIQLGETLSLDSPSCGIRMIPFTGTCDSKIFRGRVLPGGMDTQVFPSGDQGTLSARYMLEGVDAENRPCKMYIDNAAIMEKDRETVTFPRIRTDSPALRWLEAADLRGAICPRADGLDIVISAAEHPHRRMVYVQRAGLTLRGALEKKGEGRCPLVLMLHGFTGNMGLDTSYFQHLSDCLTDRGLATLRFDFNGHGVSDGAFSHMTVMNEIEDAAAFLQYAMTLDFVTDIYVLGHSQGGVVAGMLSGLYPDAVKKLVMLAPAASLKTDALEGHCMGVHYDAFHIPEKVRLGEECQVGGLYFRMARNLPLYDWTGQFKGPALVVFGGRDQVVHREAAEQYMPGFRQGEFCFYPTLDHGLMGEETDTMTEKVLHFLAE